jgi:hypothetical protein
MASEEEEISANKTAKFEVTAAPPILATGS